MPSPHDIRELIRPKMQWIRRARYKAFAYVGAICIAAAAIIAFAGAPWLPVVGAALMTAAVGISKVTTRLLKPTCLECGHDLSGEPISTHGIACPGCGSVQMPSLVDLARLDRDQSRTSTDSDETDA